MDTLKMCMVSSNQMFDFEVIENEEKRNGKTEKQKNSKTDENQLEIFLLFLFMKEYKWEMNCQRHSEMQQHYNSKVFNIV